MWALPVVHNSLAAALCVVDCLAERNSLFD
jgi:hypothetical protein